MALTLLEICQKIANDLDSDNFNSISDTIEAQQMAVIVQDTYYELFDNRTWPYSGRFIQMTGLGDINHPTHLLIPDDVVEWEFIKYDVRTSVSARQQYLDILFRKPKDFIELTNTRNSLDSNTQVVTDFGGAKLLIRNDHGPSWWTTFDDRYIVFDALDNVVDSTIQQSKVQAYGYKRPIITLTDTFEFTPDILPQQFYSLLIAESKSAASLKLRQIADTKEEQKARRQRFSASQEKLSRSERDRGIPNFGRPNSGNRSTFRIT